MSDQGKTSEAATPTEKVTVRSSRIVVGVDGSPASRAALAWAGTEAELRGAELDVVAVWAFPAYIDPLGGAYLLPGAMGETESREKAKLEESVIQVLGPNPSFPIRQITMCGSTTTELLTAAEGADLLVVGSRGRGGFLSLLLGSTALQCVQHAPCPAVVIHAPAPL